jgi:hypothetical protein
MPRHPICSWFPPISFRLSQFFSILLDFITHDNYIVFVMVIFSRSNVGFLKVFAFGPLHKQSIFEMQVGSQVIVVLIRPCIAWFNETLELVQVLVINPHYTLFDDIQVVNIHYKVWRCRNWHATIE